MNEAAMAFAAINWLAQCLIVASVSAAGLILMMALFKLFERGKPEQDESLDDESKARLLTLALERMGLEAMEAANAAFGCPPEDRDAAIRIALHVLQARKMSSMPTLFGPPEQIKPAGPPHA
jgi:hypothetical protein